MGTTPGGGERSSGLSEALNEKLSELLSETTTTYQLWRRVAELGPPGAGDRPLEHALRSALRAELARREASDEAEIYALVERALLSGDLRPYWRARAIFGETSPDLTSRLFPLEPDYDASDLEIGRDLPPEQFLVAREIIRARLAELDDATPTGSMIAVFAILEEAIAREEPELRPALLAALEVERRRQLRSERNLLRTRLALSLCEGRGYASFVENRATFAGLAKEERAKIFPRPQAST